MGSARRRTEDLYGHGRGRGIKRIRRPPTSPSLCCTWARFIDARFLVRALALGRPAEYFISGAGDRRQCRQGYKRPREGWREGTGSRSVRNKLGLHPPSSPSQPSRDKDHERVESSACLKKLGERCYEGNGIQRNQRIMREEKEKLNYYTKIKLPPLFFKRGKDNMKRIIFSVF